MKNTEYLYNAMREFTDARRENRRIYLEKKQKLDAYKGSQGYDEDLKQAMEQRNKADAEAKAKCEKIVDSALNLMASVNGKRKLTAPTAEMVNILTVARMLKKPAKPTLDSIANSLGGNALALAALNDIARDAWKDDPNRLAQFTRNYTALATNELGAETAHLAIKDLGKRCADIMNGTGANRIREMSADHAKRIHGANYDPDDLPQEAPYTSERDFYQRELSADYDLFSAAVNE